MSRSKRTGRSARRWRRSRRRSGVRPRRCRIGARRAMGMGGRGRAYPTDAHARVNALDREHRERRRAQEIVRTAARIGPRRSATAAGRDGRGHRHASRRVGRRAPLRGAAECAVHRRRTEHAAAMSRSRAETRGACRDWACGGRARAPRGHHDTRRARGLSARSRAPQVHRKFTATRPNPLWVSDGTYGTTWRGLVYVAFGLDVFARRRVGWRASTSLPTDLALDALDHARYARATDAPVVHHRDHGAPLPSLPRTFGGSRHRTVRRPSRCFL